MEGVGSSPRFHLRVGIHECRQKHVSISISMKKTAKRMYIKIYMQEKMNKNM